MAPAHRHRHQWHGATTPITVAAAITPDNDAPQAGTPAYEIDTIDTHTGTVTGHLNVTDPDATPPTKQARNTAYTTLETDTAAITISATDGHGGTTAVSITTPIAPTQVDAIDLGFGVSLVGPVVVPRTAPPIKRSPAPSAAALECR